jgi:secreted trypsin-like serine protease
MKYLILLILLTISCSKEDSAAIGLTAPTSPQPKAKSLPVSSAGAAAACRNPSHSSLNVVGGEISADRLNISVMIYSGDTVNGTSQIKKMCSATFINSHTVLTAAHCVYGMNAVYVTKEFIDIENQVKKSSIRRVASFKWFSLYDNSDKSSYGSVNDIALITVNDDDAVSEWADMNLSDGARP